METHRAANIAADTITADDVILVAVAHPDDEAVLHGGLIRHSVKTGAEVHIAFATVGEASTINHRFWRPGFVANRHRWQEVIRAAKVLGVPRSNLHSLGLPDGALHEHQLGLAESLGNLLATHAVTKVITAGQNGYDKHADHIAVDIAAQHSIAQSGSKERTLWRLSSSGDGEVNIPVDSPNKIKATTRHFSQFMGFRFFGAILLPRITKRYLENYQELVYDRETYDVYPYDNLSYPDTYRPSKHRV